MMQDKHRLDVTLSLALIFVTLAAALAATPLAKADWPSTFERYGPRVDKILTKLYSNEATEFAAFESGDLDVVDWPLTQYWIDRWSANPEIDMMDFGGEIGAFEFDLNLNETMRAAGPTGAIDGTSEPSISVNPAFRHALAHLVDRAYIVTTILQGFAVPIYSMVPPALGNWQNLNVDRHPYNPAEAADILSKGQDGILGTADDIKDNNGDTYYDWPSTNNRIVLDFVVRDDHSPGRKEAGDRLIWELANNIKASSGGVGFQVNRWSAWGSTGARKWWMEGKCADIYTGGWSLTRDPDYMFGIWHSSMYWHPGRPPNSGHIHDPELDGYLEGIYYAQNFADAKTNTWEAQRVMAEKSLILPMYANSAPKAGRVHYTGGTNGVPISPDDGENMYRGREWTGFANEYGKGLNSWWTFLNAHPDGYELSPNSATNPMIMRYGFKVPELSSLNPVYGEWLWDWEIMGKVYESFFATNPYDVSEDFQRLSKRWDVGVWDNNGVPATQITFELKNEWWWHDGVQLTSDDVMFTFVELVQATEARGLPYPWYYSNLLDVNSIAKESDFKITVKLNSLSYFAFHWIGGNIILPRHIWGPIMMGPDMTIGTADDNTYDPETFAPDPQLTGSGPFKVYPHSIDKTDYYVPYGYVLLDAYKQASTWSMDFQPLRADKVAVNGIWLSTYVTNFDIDLDFMFDLTVEVYNTNNVKVAGPWTKTGLTIQAATSSGNHPTVTIAQFNASSLTKGIKYIVRNTLSNIQMRSGGGTPGPWQPIPPSWIPPVYSSDPLYARSVNGDANNDRTVDIADATFVSFHFGLSTWVWAEGNVNEIAPGPFQDTDTEYSINMLDATVIMNNFFASG